MEDLKNHVHLKLRDLVQSCEKSHAKNINIQTVVARDLKKKQKEAQTDGTEMLSRAQDIITTGLTEQNKRATAWEEKLVTTSTAIKTVTASALKRLQDHQNHFEGALAQRMA